MKNTKLRWLYSTWWKYLSLVLLGYVFLGGLFVPLGPGLVNVSPVFFNESSNVNFTLRGYNTHFQEPSTKVYIRHQGEYFCPENLVVRSNGELKFDFLFTGSDGRNMIFDVVVNNDIDGTVALRDALTLKKNATFSDSSVATLTCEPSVKNNHFSGFSFPYREILYESIRNTFFHVPMWFGMLAVLILSLVYSIKYLNSGNIIHDSIASEAVNVSLLSGLLGILTGMLWANYTWGAPWPNDPKLNGAAVGVLIYIAYIVLRGAISDENKRARISAVYNIFAMVIYIMFIFIIPRITDSLHPGNGGNPAFSKYDLDSHMRMFFYPAVVGWSLLFVWLVSMRVRLFIISKNRENE